MEYDEYAFAAIEPDILEFWEENRVYERAKERGADGEPFYFLDGPPYTSGSIHIGTAWNKTMKDVVLRYRRMQGFAVWDRAGYDMHGLPNEHGTMEELGLQTKEDIEEYGVDRYITACEERAVENLERMNEDFARLGVWMDFENAYQTTSEEWIEAVWWLVKNAHEDGRLYQGLRPMAWDPVHETACAKHELEYKSVEDASIYVKFKLREKSDEYLIIWTTTPWTIPFNLMVMANPDEEYVKLRVEDETWIVAEALAEDVLDAAGVDGEVVESFPGKELEGEKYDHFLDEFSYETLEEDHPNVHTVVLSEEYVTVEHGTGLVHAAPGCGPEDYEVGVRMDVPAYNLLDAQGRFPDGVGDFSNRTAREDDEYFTDLFDMRGALVAVEPYVHDYPHAERSKAPVVYKTTEQWFFRVDDRKEEMIANNDEVHWMPKAGYNAFNSWLENLRDNSITKQRYWGTPFPVWQNVDDPDDVIVVESREELEGLASDVPEDLHKPWIDEVVIEKDGSTYERIPDVIDVWVDAGVASWACLDFPQRDDLLDEYFPADFIIEGNDQVRGWFNLLMVTSTLAFGRAPFENVYMHGMINDAKGRKMSKSEGNYILPEEVVSRYGADASRLYWIGGTKAGQDLNYNFPDCETKHKNLFVYWNIHKYLLDAIATTGQSPVAVSDCALSYEDEYVLSKAHNASKAVSELLEDYAIDRIPDVVEDLLDTISRTYIQHVRSRLSTGTDEDRRTVVSVLWHAYDVAIRLLAPICPFITEAAWQNLKEPLALAEDSVHHAAYPAHDDSFIDGELEASMERAQQVISVLLAARDKAHTGVRWPLRKAFVKAEPLSDEAEALVCEHTNVRELSFVDELDLSYEVAPDYRAIGEEYGEQTADIADYLNDNPDEASQQYMQNGVVEAAGHDLSEEYLEITPVAPDGFVFAADKDVSVLLSTAQDEELLREGYFRELLRRVQRLRKQADLDKTDRIHLYLSPDAKEVVVDMDELKAVVGADEVSFDDPSTCPHVGEDAVRERTLRYGFFHLDT